MKPQHLALILLIDVIWAFNIVAVKYSVMEMGALASVCVRYIFVLVICLPWLKWLPGKMTLILAAGIIGGAMSFGLAGLSFALADNVASLAIAGQLGVPFSLILAVIVLKERIHWPRIFGILLAFAGVGILSFDPHVFDERIALLLTVAASFCWAVSSLLFRNLKGVSALTIHAWLAVVSIPLLAGASAIFEPGEIAGVADVPLSTFGWLAYSAIGASIVGHVGMSWLLQRYPVSTLSPLTLPTPLLSAIIAVAVLGNPVSPQLVAGGVVALVGVAIITIRTAQAREAKPA
ncbi:DMT family transporter [Bradyrhizobium sp.]|uniref:DMT family transporter n=1 Tax=Bradyrhizobium sp. TaxID=376 RepID=UPI0025BAF765|nr:DMT family transporter [Bradyrhizobium sp.]MCA3571144.1 DMT family transporter [Bradyrhizobium sp.]